MNQVESHYENFTLKDFMYLDNLNLSERLSEIKSFNEKLLTVYEREILTSSAKEVCLLERISHKERKVLMFGSNNYLGLTTHPYVVEKVKEAVDIYGAGVGGPPLLNGTTRLHKELIKKICKFKGFEDAIIFPSGFSTNVGWVTALVKSKDIVFFDEYNHASFFTGLKLTGCKKIPFRHNDINDLKNKLMRYKDSGLTKWIVVEGVYSMDGDLPPLKEIVRLAKEYSCHIAIDDAHGTGVMGDKGTGIVEHFEIDKNDITINMGTFSTSFGVVGGFIGANKSIINYLKIMASSFIFSASLPAHVCAAVIAGIEVMEKEQDLVKKLHGNAQYLIAELKKRSINTTTASAIIPIVIPKDKDIREIIFKISDRGIFINSVEYPAVLHDKQRLRISVMATHTKDDLDKLVKSITEVFFEVGILNSKE
jgi:glycine C-acetyltransferase